jgi:hypothetical protein
MGRLTTVIIAWGLALNTPRLLRPRRTSLFRRPPVWPARCRQGLGSVGLSAGMGRKWAAGVAGATALRYVYHLRCRPRCH